MQSICLWKLEHLNFKTLAFVGQCDQITFIVNEGWVKLLYCPVGSQLFAIVALQIVCYTKYLGNSEEANNNHRNVNSSSCLYWNILANRRMPTILRSHLPYLFSPINVLFPNITLISEQLITRTAFVSSCLASCSSFRLCVRCLEIASSDFPFSRLPFKRKYTENRLCCQANARIPRIKLIDIVLFFLSDFR